MNFQTRLLNKQPEIFKRLASALMKLTSSALRMLFDQPQIAVHGRNNMFASNTLLVAPLACDQI